jgi:16S rRNA (uracil1498-N3)-methyltransferase
MASAPRFFVDADLRPGDVLTLPPGAARHAQVLRMQPGQALTVFNGQGPAHAAEVLRMGRSDVQVRMGMALAESPASLAWATSTPRVTLAVGMPANERMDWLVEKATELGAVAFMPLIAERSVLRMRGERADKKLGHWRGVAVSACEQSGRFTVPSFHPVRSTTEFLGDMASGWTGEKWVLSLAGDAQALPAELASLGQSSLPAPELLCLSGPEGGLTAAEEAAARHAGFKPVALGPLTLRAETAPLVVLSALLATRWAA